MLQNFKNAYSFNHGLLQVKFDVRYKLLLTDA